MSLYRKSDLLVPSKVTIYFESEDTDPSEFPNALVRPAGGFLVVHDLTKTPTVAHFIPAERIDVVTAEELPT